MTSTRSEVWYHFEKYLNDNAKCNVCGDIIQCRGGSTSPLINHLKRHSIMICKRTSVRDGECVDVSSKKIMQQSSLSSFFKNVTIGELLGKCAAKDGFSLNAILKSEALKEFIQKRGYVMPRSATTIHKHILDYYQLKIDDLKNKLHMLKAHGNKFSITVDEWTDISVKRYLNVTLHSKDDTYNLGLVQIHGSCTAETTQMLVKTKLMQFELDFSDIVASTHDGASVMQKYGRLIEAENQLCYNHAIHLSVVKVFYKETEEVMLDNITEEFYESDSDDLDEIKLQSITTNKIIDNNINFIDEYRIENYINISLRQENIKISLGESRILIKFFKKSSVRKAILQKYVKVQEGKELSLLLDCKTRWNSLVPMIERLLKLKFCISRALHDIGQMDHLYSEANFLVLENILNILKPIELGVVELSRRGATLLTAEGVFKFIFKKLNEINTEISKNMLITLKQNISKRRNVELV